MAGKTYRNGKVHILSEQCSTCIFRPGNLMHLQRGRVREMVEETRKQPGGNITCHQTLDGDHAICRGWWDRYADEDFVCVLAKAKGIVQEVTVAKARP